MGLFQTKEFVVTKQPIYKFGKTTKLNHGALEEHPVGTIVIFQISCDDCHVLERKINSLFTVNYEPKKRNERGFFKGNHHGMFEDMFMFFRNSKNTSLINAQIREYRRKIVKNEEEGKVDEEVKVEDEVEIMEEVTIEEEEIVEEVTIEEVEIVEEVTIEEETIEEVIEEIDVHTCCCSISRAPI